MKDLATKAIAGQTEDDGRGDHVPAVHVEKVTIPLLVSEAGTNARFAWEEFIFGRLRNPHTRAAYERAIRQFLEYCEKLGRELRTIAPRDVGTYLDRLDYAPATKKLHLSALRHFFDTLVTRHAIAFNPALSVRGERLQVVEGKTREIPVRHDLQQFINRYLSAGGLSDSDKSTPIFRTTIRRTRKLTTNGMTSGDMGRMVKRRLRQAGLPLRLSPHSFRVTTITDLLSQGVPLEDVQMLAGHADPRTTRLYDRRHRQVTRNIVERISV